MVVASAHKKTGRKWLAALIGAVLLAAGLAAPLAAAKVATPSNTVPRVDTSSGDPIVAVPHLSVDLPDQTGSITQPGGSADLTTAMTVTQVNSITDVVFVIDTTESMGNAIAAVNTGLGQFTKNLADAGGTDLAFGVFAFGDTSTGIWSEWHPSLTPLTSTYTASDVVRAINSATKFNGGDGPEDSLLALATVAAQTPWREGSQREIVLVTDAGSHVRNCPNWCVDGVKADLAGVKTLVAAANAHVTVLPINQHYTGLDQSDVPLVDLAGAFGDPSLVEPAWYALLDRLTQDVIVQNSSVSPITVTGDLSITYADGTASSDVTATVTPSVDTTISSGTPASFTVQATASANPARPGATTTVCLEYKLIGTDTVVARQTITFTAPAAVNIVFHDDVSGTDVAPLAGFNSVLTGQPGDTVNFAQSDAEDGFDHDKYTFVSMNTNVTTFTSDPQTITVHLKHKSLTSSVVSTRTIHYTGAGASTPADHSDTITWSKTTDAITGAVTSCTTPDAGYPAVDSPMIAGYTVDPANVAAEQSPVNPATCPPANSQATVAYTVIPTSVTVVFHDDALGEDVAPLPGFVATRTGNPGDVFSFTNTDAAAGFDGSKYNLDSIDGVPVFTFSPQTVTVHLTHKSVVASVVSTRTIHYTGAGASTPVDHSDTITWSKTTDVVTGLVTGCTTVDAGYPLVISPLVASYVASPAAVAAEPAPVNLATCPPADSTAAVVYTVIPTAISIVFHDDALGEDVAPLSGFVATRTGNPGDVFSFTNTDAAAGFDASKYNLDRIENVAAFTFSSQTVTVHLTHKSVVTSVASTRTIHYTGAGAATPADHSDSINWTKTTDAVTGVMTGCTTADAGYPPVASPAIATYAASPPNVAAEPAPVSPAACPPADSATTVTYIKIPDQTIDIVFYDDDLNQDVTPLPGFDAILSGQPGVAISFEQADAEKGFDTSKYEFVYMNTVNLFTRASQTITVHLAHKLDNGSVDSTRTIHYTGAGDQTPADHADSITWVRTTDAVTGAMTGCTTADVGYPAVDSPAVDGYTVDPASVAAEPAPVSPTICPPANSEVSVTYTEVPDVTVTIKFFDDDSSVYLTPLAGFDTVLTGKPGDPIVFAAADAAPGYDGAKYALQKIDKGQVFTTTSQTVSVHVTHKKAVANVNVPRTIHYSGAGANTPADVVQTITWVQTKDLATGVSTCAASSPDYPAVTSPAVAGYDANPATAPTLDVTALPNVCPPPSVETVVQYTEAMLVVQTGGTSANFGAGILPVAMSMGLSGVALLGWLRRRSAVTPD